jgi:hypothetical protein
MIDKSSFGSLNIGGSISKPWFDVSTSDVFLDTIESSRLWESSTSDYDLAYLFQSLKLTYPLPDLLADRQDEV